MSYRAWRFRRRQRQWRRLPQDMRQFIVLVLRSDR